MINPVDLWLHTRKKNANINIGFNVGTVAGQKVMHCHCHVIPRYVGDVPYPRGGVRGVVPGKRGY
jgi:diadenosine tetraphosphate (Ap4A) HIT family hydrolase